LIGLRGWDVTLNQLIDYAIDEKIDFEVLDYFDYKDQIIETLQTIIYVLEDISEQQEAK